MKFNNEKSKSNTPIDHKSKHENQGVYSNFIGSSAQKNLTT